MDLLYCNDSSGYRIESPALESLVVILAWIGVA